jgi:hypothetical protein
MRAGAQTPEELESMLEDALVVRRPEAVASLFEGGAVLVGGDLHARGGEQIARLALAMWAGESGYVADPRRVTQARDIALVVTEHGVNVARRSDDGSWRYTIVVASAIQRTEGSER